MRDAEVVVVGGGVAGTATAVALARRGHAVIVLDRATFPREKPCGEGLMPHGVRALDALGLGGALRAGRPMPFTGIAYHVDGVSAVGRFPDGRTGYGVRRLLLDAALHDAARAAGVEVRTDTRVRRIHGVGGDMTVESEDGALRCRAVVGADGLRSPLRRQLGWEVPARGRLRYGLRGHYRLAPGHVDRDVVDVYAGPIGELYLTPTGPGEMNVALLLEREASRSFAGDLDGAMASACASTPEVARLLAGAVPISAPRLVGPLRQEASRIAGDGVLLVGDAAGFVDAITGEGMSLGLLGAQLAAEVLSEGLRWNRLATADLEVYARRRTREARDLLRLTELVLWGIRHRRLARRVVHNLGRHPELFGRVLAINSGSGSLGSLGLRGVARLLAG